MGLLGFIWNIFRAKRSANVLAPGRGWTVPVVGEASYQADIESLYRKHGGDGHDLKVSAVVAPEEGNQFDANAVRIEIDGRTVGYLSRSMAVEYRAALGVTVGRCSAKIGGGHETHRSRPRHCIVALYSFYRRPAFVAAPEIHKHGTEIGPACRG